MKLCIVGAGAIGGLLAARLARAGHQVTVVARGAHLAAIQTGGIKLLSKESEFVVPLHAVEDSTGLGQQDFVFVTTKAHALPPFAEQLGQLLGPTTPIVTGMNGVPYWYFYRLDPKFPERSILSVDPGGVLWSTIGPERAIGCVVYPSAEVTAPGVVRHVEGDRFAIGEPDGRTSDRVASLSKILIHAGFKAPIRARIRDDLWIKLWGNLAFNPMSALTNAPLDLLLNDPEVRKVCRAMMLEAQVVAERLGARIPIDVDRRIDGAAAIIGHKTSMLQDLERGRPMEIDALVTAVQEFADIVGVSTPTIDLVAALVKQRGRVAGCYPT